MIYTSPKPHQVEGARFLVNKRVALIGAKTGKGKTLIALACIHQHVSQKRDYAVVFSPVKAYDKVWEQEIKKHSDLKTIRLPEAFELYKKTGSIDFLYDYDVMLVKYPDVKMDYYAFLRDSLKDRITVYDEAHRLKNPDTNVVKLLLNLTSGFNQVRAKWGLTATAIGNDILDLWGIFFFLDARIFGTEWQFKTEYCELEDKVIGWKTKFGRKIPDTRKVVVGYKNLDKLKIKLNEFYWAVGSDINVNFHEISYTMNSVEEDAYIQAALGILQKDNMKGFAQRIPDLQRTADGAYDSDGQLTVDFRGSKYEAYLSEINKKLSANQSVILFAEFLDTFDMLDRLLTQDLPNVPIYRISGRGIEDAVKFPCVVLATMGGTESLNLKFANHVFCYSVPFSVNSFIQLVGRITRMDSDYLDDLNVYLPMCENNIDRYKNLYLLRNTELINDVLGKDANLPVSQLDNMRLGLLDDLRKELLWRSKVKKKSTIHNT